MFEYNEKVLEHFRNPKNMGEIKNPDGKAVVGNPVCVLPQTLIYKNDEITTIKQIKKGNKVLTHDGGFYEVKKTYKRHFSGSVCSILVHNLGRVITTPDHHILALRISPFSHKFEAFMKQKALLDWCQASELKKGDFLAYPILSETKRTKSINFNVPVPKWDFKSKGLPETVNVSKGLLRLVGYYVAEGFVRTDRCKGTLGFVFGAHEKEFIKDTILLVERAFGLKPSKIRHIHNSTNILFYSARLARFFERLLGKGAVNKRLPRWIMLLPPSDQRGLLCGLWRGDGYINPQKKVAKYVTVSKQLAYQIRMLLLRQRIIFSFLKVAEKGIHKEHYCLYVREESSLKNLIRIVGLDAELLPKTKNPHKSWFSGQFYFVSIRKIERLNYRGLVYNLEVAGAASYTTNSAVLHNCGDIMQMTIRVGKNKKGEEMVKDVKFKALGCGAAIATSSVGTAMVKGKTLEKALELSNEQVVAALGGLPPTKIHCSNLAAEAVRKAIEDYKKKG